MPPHHSSISDVAHSAITFRYKKYAKVLAVASVISQFGITASNYSFAFITPLFSDGQQDILYYLIMVPQVTGPLLSGYLIDRRLYRQTLLIAMILAIVGQAFITISTLLYPVNFILVAIGRPLYALGFSMTMPALVRFLLMWLNPDSIPIWLAVLFSVQIVSQTFGTFLFKHLLSGHSAMELQAVTIGLCLFSLCFAILLWYLDKIANIHEAGNTSMLIMHPVYANFRNLMSVPFLIWAIIASTAASLTNIYIFQIYQQDFISNEVSDGIAAQGNYLQFIFSGFCFIGLFIYGKTLKVEKQKLGILTIEHLLAILGFGLLLINLSWATYIPAIAVLAVSQAGLYLTFFIIILTMMKWELLGIMIGIFYCIRNILVLATTAFLEKISKTFEDETDQQQFRLFIICLLTITGVVGFSISGIFYLMNRKKKLTMDGHATDENSALLQNYRSPGSLNQNSISSV